MGRFQQRLKSLGFETYEAYLRSDHWQVVRKHYAASDRPQRCDSCRSPRYQLHHRTYKRLGEEVLDDLVPLCQRCHYLVHKWLERNRGQSLWTAHERFKTSPAPRKRKKRKREKAGAAPKSPKKRKREPHPFVVRHKNKPSRFVTDLAGKPKKKKKRKQPPPPKKTPMMRIKEDREESLGEVIARARVATPTHDRFDARQKLGRLHRRAVRLGDDETQAEILNSGIRPL